MKRTEIITLFVLFASVFVLVGVLRYLNLYEGLQDEDEEEAQGDTFAGDVTPPTPPSGGGPPPTSGGGPVPADASVTKFSAF